MSNLALVKSEDFHGVQCDFWYDPDNDSYFMTAEQLGSALGYATPRESVNKLASRHEYLREPEFSSEVKMTSEAGSRETRVFTEDGIYEVTMLAKTPRAREFRAKVRQVLKELRTGRLTIESMENVPYFDKFEQARLLVQTATAFKNVLPRKTLREMSYQAVEILIGSRPSGDEDLPPGLVVWDNIPAFFEQHTVLPGGYITKDNLYNLYKAWCSEKNYPPAARQRLNQYLKGKYPSVREDTNGIRKWMGITVVRKEG